MSTYRGISLPDDMRETLSIYATASCDPGGFMQAVLANDLMDAVGRADERHLAALPAICGFIYNELPSQCHGSREKVAAWLGSRSKTKAFDGTFPIVRRAAGFVNPEPPGKE